MTVIWKQCIYHYWFNVPKQNSIQLICAWFFFSGMHEGLSTWCQIVLMWLHLFCLFKLSQNLWRNCHSAHAYCTLALVMEIYMQSASVDYSKNVLNVRFPSTDSEGLHKLSTLTWFYFAGSIPTIRRAKPKTISAPRIIFVRTTLLKYVVKWLLEWKNIRTILQLHFK